jgi:hypothetical protein
MEEHLQSCRKNPAWITKMYAGEECPPCYVYIEFLSLGAENDELLAKGVIPERFRLPGIKYKELSDIQQEKINVSEPASQKIDDMEVDNAVLDAYVDSEDVYVDIEGSDDIILFNEVPLFGQDDFSEESIQNTLPLPFNEHIDNDMDIDKWKDVLPGNLKHKMI